MICGLEGQVLQEMGYACVAGVFANAAAVDKQSKGGSCALYGYLDSREWMG